MNFRKGEMPELTFDDLGSPLVEGRPSRLQADTRAQMKERAPFSSPEPRVRVPFVFHLGTETAPFVLQKCSESAPNPHSPSYEMEQSGT